MAIAVECAQCGKQLKVKDELAGRKGKCPQCQGVIHIPAAAGAPVAVGAAAARPGKLTTATADHDSSSVPLPVKPVAAVASATAPAKVSGKLTDEQFREQVLAAFNGQMTPPKVGFGRKFGAMLVLLILAALPVFYFAVIGALGYGMFFLATTYIAWPHPALMWVAEVAIGLFLLGLIKPLIEPQRRGEQAHPVDLRQEETLREFTTKICQQIDAPQPKTIQLECSTRMAADKGGSVVTLGLPAIAAMSVDQFACVLAGLLSLHRPKAGCRVMNMIRGINYWLWRSVYGKSRFERWLARVAERPHFHAAKLLLPLKVMKFPAQIVLFVPMFIANTIAQSVVRAAELDADHAAARLVGRRTFAAVLERLEQINFSWDGVLADLKFLNKEDRLPDSLPEQVALRMLDMSPELWGALRDTVNAPDEKPFDTKPIASDRLEAVQNEPADGVLKCSLPASRLFSDYEGLSRTVTAGFYTSRFGSK